ncbi:oxygenase MpaB family protein [Aeromicrobium sp.]|uniref:oxygenase MpaB family protein n=1 Tax=Aeromicrobium sp. TaxID=1871063 RepID=UPI0028AAA9A0|nr:oxygenase MpaB family protein [Aeromicrobium sp.]
MTSVAMYPSRYRSAEERSRRIGRVLKYAGGVKRPDEQLLARLGTAFTEQDELGARLAGAMRLRADDPDRVTMTRYRAALEGGLQAVPDAPPALVEFMRAVEQDPPWLDRELVDEGARVFRRFGRNAADVLLQLSLIGGYRFGGPPDLLVATGGLTGDSTRRRLAETQSWAVAVTTPGGLEQYAPGWRTTLHVRAMHALVNQAFSPRWDVERWGLPINQADQAGTLGLFDGTVLIGVKALGVPVSRDESLAVMHLWKYVGWLMGVDEHWLVDTERERHRLNYHVVLAQADITEAGPKLAQDIISVLGTLPHGRWKTERNLSMLSVFLGRESMRELGLPWRPPWALGMLWTANTVRHRVLGRLPGGRERLDTSGGAVAQRILAEYYGSDDREVADLPA